MFKDRLLLVNAGKTIETFVRELLLPLNHEVISAKDYKETKTFLNQSLPTAIVAIVAIVIDQLKQSEELIDELLLDNVPVILLSDSTNTPEYRNILSKDVLYTIENTDKEGLLKLPEIIQTFKNNSTKKILVVDDSAVFRLLMTSILKEHHFITLEATDGIEAVEVLDNNKDINLVISDFEMPNMNGLELVHKIRDDYKADELPIIIVSAIGQNSVTVSCLREGANDYIHKPFEPEEFISRVNLILFNQSNIDRLSEQKVLLEDYKKIIDKTTVITRTNRNGVITHASEAMVALSGYSIEELIGQTHNLLRHPDTTDELYKELWNTISSGQVWAGELKNKTKHGELFWVQTTITPELDENGVILGYNAVSHNNTLKKKLEALTHNLASKVSEEITKNKQQASYMLQQSRLAQMGEMISMIAHQWRQPLASISAITGTLTLDVIMDNYKKEFFQERLESITELAQHLSATINDFRNFFKEKKNEETISLDAIVDLSLKIIGPSLQNKNMIIEKKIDSGILLTTYPNEVKQVLLNLLRNSEEALEENRASEAKISIHGYMQDDTVYLCVEDNAGGIPDDIIDKIFDPYFSTKIKKDGTGLGLYMSKTIIEEHCEGRINVHNTDLGACFELCFPLKLSKGTAL